jgi:hypothetical protein
MAPGLRSATYAAPVKLMLGRNTFYEEHMKPHTRRAIAFIAGSIITGKNSSSVYDYSESKHFMFSGEATLEHVNIYDYGEKCHVSGSGSSSSFSLFHYGNSKHIQLSIQGTSFNGFDYETNKHFNGTVSGGSISLYDYEEGKHFNFSL